jgi:hypothetical protein
MKLCPRLSWLLAACVLLLTAAESSWKDKPISDWTEQDARQILSDSPWAKTVTAGLTRVQTEDERREGGNMGQPHGVGFDGVGEKEAKPRIPNIFDRSTPSAPGFVKLRVRWETALPVRVAELKAREIEPPTLEGEGYRIAVYRVPASYVNGDPKTLGNPLKKLASLKREGKKDVKPSSVEVFQREDGMAVVYLFPLSAEISMKDAVVDFEAVIGRIVLKQSFPVQQMLFEGRLEL